MVFCGTCLAWVKILNTPEFVTRAYNVPLDMISLSLPSYRALMIMLSVLGVISILYVIIYITTIIVVKNEKNHPSSEEYSKLTESSEQEAEKAPENTSLLHLIGFFNAFVFSVGLGFAGMTSLLKSK